MCRQVAPCGRALRASAPAFSKNAATAGPQPLSHARSSSTDNGQQLQGGCLLPVGTVVAPALDGRQEPAGHTLAQHLAVDAVPHARPGVQQPAHLVHVHPLGSGEHRRQRGFGGIHGGTTAQRHLCAQVPSFAR